MSTTCYQFPVPSQPNRAEYDFYPTPEKGVWPLLNEVEFTGDIWEPACGDGAISSALQNAGYDVISTDLINRGYGQGGVDFLQSTKPLGKNIVTNPPYGAGLADQFIKKALEHCQSTGGKVAMLLNLQSLCHPLRNQAFKNTPPKAIYGLDNLVCYPNGDTSRYITNKHRYCWVVWEPGFTGRPEFWWLTAEKPH